VFDHMTSNKVGFGLLHATQLIGHAERLLYLVICFIIIVANAKQIFGGKASEMENSGPVVKRNFYLPRAHFASLFG